MRARAGVRTLSLRWRCKECKVFTGLWPWGNPAHPSGVKYSPTFELQKLLLFDVPGVHFGFGAGLLSLLSGGGGKEDIDRSSLCWRSPWEKGRCRSYLLLVSKASKVHWTQGLLFKTPCIRGAIPKLHSLTSLAQIGCISTVQSLIFSALSWVLDLAWGAVSHLQLTASNPDVDPFDPLLSSLSLQSSGSTQKESFVPWITLPRTFFSAQLGCS